MTQRMCKGSRYVIRNRTLAGEVIDEGVATLRRFVAVVPSALSHDEIWDVQFDGESETVERVILTGDWVA